MLDATIDLAREKTPRGQVRLADNPVVQSDIAQCEAALSAAETWLHAVLREVHADVCETPVSSVDIPTRGRVRLACSHAIKTALDVAETCYRLAGVSAIFKGAPLERRYRDIRTLSQQIQSRLTHLESVGQVLLGDAPEVFY